MTRGKQRKWRLLTRLHRWAGLVLGIQVTLWFASGLFMTLPPIDRVRGTHMLADAPAPPALPASAVASAIANYGADVSEVRSFSVGPRALVRLDGANGPTFYGPDGEPAPPPSESEVAEVATSRYAGDGTLRSVEFLSDAPLDYRGTVPVWRASFDDDSGTRFYMDPRTAEVRRVRTDLWRVFDTMWMLHVMGYPDRDNFNTWWLRLAAAAGLLFSLSGMALVVHRTFLRPKRQVTAPPEGRRARRSENGDS